MKPIKQAVYLSSSTSSEYAVFYIDSSADKLHIEDVKHEQGYFFTPEQLNEYTKTVGKIFLQVAAEKAFTKTYHSLVDSYERVDKQSITNTFDETFKQFKV